MEHIYKPGGLWETDEADPARCRAAVHNPGRMMGFHQCYRNPVRDGWCAQHHPDVRAERDRQAKERYEAAHKRDPSYRLAKARIRIANLEAALKAPGVEWRDYEFETHRYCPWCDAAEPDGHKPDCQRQLALEAR